MATSFAAAPPRVACPACGNAVHPIAGRCRHCRVDLTRARVDGPTAATATATNAAASSTLRPRIAFVAALGVAIAIAIVVRFVIAGAAPAGL